MSGGQSYCRDLKRGCRTPAGRFTIYRKQAADCVSKKFPLGEGGAKMPYCMFCSAGYAVHGSYAVPGHHASHGCVRIFVEDAKWLYRAFVTVGETQVWIDHPITARPQADRNDTASGR
jgi:L,D-transpeptidase ErfK/SrfK